MPLSDALLPEFDLEMANTRKTLERVPADKLDWTPHIKSMTMGGLATHLSKLPSWTNYTIEEDSLDLAPGGVPLPAGEPRSHHLLNYSKFLIATWRKRERRSRQPAMRICLRCGRCNARAPR